MRHKAKSQSFPHYSRKRTLLGVRRRGLKRLFLFVGIDFSRSAAFLRILDAVITCLSFLLPPFAAYIPGGEKKCMFEHNRRFPANVNSPPSSSDKFLAAKDRGEREEGGGFGFFSCGQCPINNISPSSLLLFPLQMSRATKGGGDGCLFRLHPWERRADCI